MSQKKTGREVAFALNRPRVWIPVLAGVGLIATGVSTVAGLILIAIGAAKVHRVLAHDDLDQRLRLKKEKRRHRIFRALTLTETREILALDAYCTELTKTGGEETLGEEVMTQAWQIIAEMPGEDAGPRLTQFRQSLPLLTQKAAPNATDELRHKLERELHVLRATQKEIEMLG